MVPQTMPYAAGDFSRLFDPLHEGREGSESTPWETSETPRARMPKVSTKEVEVQAERTELYASIVTD